MLWLVPSKRAVLGMLCHYTHVGMQQDMHSPSESHRFSVCTEKATFVKTNAESGFGAP